MINMDSNGSNEDRTTEVNKMEVSDSAAQDKSDEQDMGKVSSAKVVTEESNESKDVNSACSESNKIEGDFLPSITTTTEDEKINTIQTDSEVKEAEKVTDDNKPNSVASSDKDSDLSELETIELKLVSPDIPKDEDNDSNYAVNNKDIDSTKDPLDIEDLCDKQIINDEERTHEKQKVENIECQNDSEDTEKVELVISTRNIEKGEDIQNTETVDDKKDIKDTQITMDLNNSAVDVKDITDEKEVKDIADVSIDTKEIKTNIGILKIKKIKESVETIESKEWKSNVIKKQEVKTESIKDIEKIEEGENRKIIAIKVNKVLKDTKIVKEDKDEKNVKAIKNITSVSNANMSMNTREGNRKRRMTMKSAEQSTPTAQQESLSQQQQQQQQNGSTPKRKRTAVAAASTVDEPPVTTPTAEPSSKNDRFCWRCHKEAVEMECSACPRSWHRRCMGGAPPLTVTDWLCSECTGVIEAEAAKRSSPAEIQLTVEQLIVMLKHIVQRMREQTGSEPFLKAVDLDEVPNYLDYVINPMDLSLLESNIRAKKYASTDAFMADAKWIQHNCIVFNTYSSKLTNTAKQMLKVARQEVSEIEACPDCFAHGRNLPKPLPSWFIEPCRRPHPIVWAKLKGFPFWPAKAMPRLNAQGQVDVRFFGEHDRAWISPKDIYLYSLEPPAGTPKKKKFEMEQCVKEVQDHVKKIERVFGEFRYAPSKISYDPHDPKQIQLSLPYYDPLENKVIKKENPKNEAQTPAANNKVTPVKIDRKSINSKNTVETSTNGGVGNTTENTAISGRRKLLRKKRSLSPQPQETPTIPKKANKLSPEVETIAVIPPKKSKSKSPPAATTTSAINNVNNKSNNKEVNKISTPETTPKLNTTSSNSNSTPKPTLLPVRKVRREVIRKIKLTKEGSKLEEPIRKPMVVVKTLNISKPATIIHSMPPIGNFADNLEATPVKILGTTKKLVSILPKKNQNVSGKVMSSKTIQVIQQDGKVVNRMIKTINMPVSKDIAKFPLVPTSQQKDKNDSLSSNSNKPMIAIPLSAKKDQKNIFNENNSSMSETAKHFNNGEKEIRLNSAVTIIKQEPKDDVLPPSPSTQPKLTIVRKPGKARKSLSNRPPPFPQQTASQMSKSNASVTSEKTSKHSNDIRSAPSASLANSTSSIVSSSSCTGSLYELPPSEAGPATAQIHRHSKDLANKLAQLITDTIRESAESNEVAAGSNLNNHEATIHYLKLRMERMKWEHEQEINEIKHNNDLKLREMKVNLEIEHHRALESARREAEIDKRRSVEETKRKQWCVVCGREAMFFCCWNTAYCDYPCQQKHWAAHVNNCAQKNPPSSQSSSSSAVSTPQTQTQRHSSNAAKQQVMPKLVISKPQSMPVMKKASS